MQQAQERTEEQIADIQRHKYLLSEQAGYDVGWEFAEQDWLEHHAPTPEVEPEVTMTKTTSAGLGGLLKRFFGRG
ncbi:MAG: hypothetical protein WBD20_09365 [Pirellulaceae bacterium]